MKEHNAQITEANLEKLQVQLRNNIAPSKKKRDAMVAELFATKKSFRQEPVRN